MAPSATPHPASATTALPAERHLLRARDLADLRYREPIDVAAMAHAAGLSKAYFSRAFKQAFGESPRAYLLTRRLERAAALLANTDDSVTEICLAVGLNSLGSFTTSFSRIYGVSPTAYRAAHPASPRIPACLLLEHGRRPNRTFREDSAAAEG